MGDAPYILSWLAVHYAGDQMFGNVLLVMGRGRGIVFTRVECQHFSLLG